MRNLSVIVSVCMLWLLGQSTILSQEPAAAEVIESSSPLNLLQSAVRKSADDLKPTVVQVKLEGYSSQTRTIISGGSTTRTSSSNLILNGAVISDQGHIVVSGRFNANSVEQVEVQIGKLEVSGEIVGKSDRLNMTLIEIAAHPDIKSVFSLPLGTLNGGDFTVLVEAGKETWDYQPMLSLAMCRGAIPGNYTKYLLDQSSSRFKGAPVVSLDGKFVGLASSTGEVFAIEDIREELEELIQNASEGEGSTEAQEKRKGWLGATILPLNEDYAKLKSLPEHAILVAHVSPDSPAEKSGLRGGDLLVGVHGKPLRFSGQRSSNLFFHLLRPRRGLPFELSVLREGEEVVLNGKFSKMPEPETLQVDDLGITISQIKPQDVVSQNLFQKDGVRITVVKKGSPAAVSGSMRKTLLAPGDVITGIGEIPTPNLIAFRNALRQIRQRGDKVLLVEYWRGRTTGYAGLNLGLGENAN